MTRISDWWNARRTRANRLNQALAELDEFFPGKLDVLDKGGAWNDGRKPMEGG